MAEHQFSRFLGLGFCFHAQALIICQHHTASIVRLKEIAGVHLADGARCGGDSNETELLCCLDDRALVGRVEVLYFIQEKGDGHILFVQKTFQDKEIVRQS